MNSKIRSTFSIILFLGSTPASAQAEYAETCNLPSGSLLTRDSTDCKCPPGSRKELKSETHEDRSSVGFPPFIEKIYHCIAEIPTKESYSTAQPQNYSQPQLKSQAEETSDGGSHERTDEWFFKQAVAVGAIGLGAIAIVAGAPVFAAGGIAMGVAMAFFGVGAVFIGTSLLEKSILAPVTVINKAAKIIIQ